MYDQTISIHEINRFVGSELAKEIGIISEYVNGIPVHLQEKFPVGILPADIVELQESENVPE